MSGILSIEHSSRMECGSSIPVAFEGKSNCYAKLVRARRVDVDEDALGVSLLCDAVEVGLWLARNDRRAVARLDDEFVKVVDGQLV